MKLKNEFSFSIDSACFIFWNNEFNQPSQQFTIYIVLKSKNHIKKILNIFFSDDKI